jgi:hypothetical protein
VNSFEHFFFTKGTASILKHLPVGTLTTTGGSDDHESVTHLDGIVELEDLLNEELDFLDVVVLAGL